MIDCFHPGKCVYVDILLFFLCILLTHNKQFYLFLFRNNSYSTLFLFTIFPPPSSSVFRYFSIFTQQLLLSKLIEIFHFSHQLFWYIIMNETKCNYYQIIDVNNDEFFHLTLFYVNANFCKEKLFEDIAANINENKTWTHRNDAQTDCQWKYSIENSQKFLRKITPMKANDSLCNNKHWCASSQQAGKPKETLTNWSLKNAEDCYLRRIDGCNALKISGKRKKHSVASEVRNTRNHCSLKEFFLIKNY